LISGWTDGQVGALIELPDALAEPASPSTHVVEGVVLRRR
jgi:hypothetical protein